MASINNITIKNLRSFEGREGTCYQGNVWYKGKKLGFWSQDGDGAICDNFDFNELVLKEEVEKYKQSKYVSDEYRKITSIETLLSDLVDLTLDEKDYRKQLKAGRPYMLVTTDGYHLNWTASPAEFSSEKINAFVEARKKEYFKDWDGSYKLYSSLDDFTIVA